MPSTAEAKTPSGTTSVKLGHRRVALAQIAERKKRSVHSLLLEAVDLYTKQDQAWADFEAQAVSAYENMQATGLHSTHAEMKEWAQSLQTANPKPLPVCHT